MVKVHRPSESVTNHCQNLQILNRAVFQHPLALIFALKFTSVLNAILFNCVSAIKTWNVKVKNWKSCYMFRPALAIIWQCSWVKLTNCILKLKYRYITSCCSLFNCICSRRPPFHRYMVGSGFMRFSLSWSSCCRRRSVDQFVLVSGSPLEPMTRFYLFSFRLTITLFFFLGRPLWREDGSVTSSAIADWSGHWGPITTLCRLIWDCVPSSSPLTTRRNYGGGILTRLHTGNSEIFLLYHI
jgi:hypothetical protein